MEHPTRGEVEILVHTSAPSRGQDDARYRALARAYLNFEPTNRLELRAGPGDIAADEGEIGSQLQEELLNSAQDYDPNASYCPSTPEGPETNASAYQDGFSVESQSHLMPSPQLSFRSVFDNRDSPIFRTRSNMRSGMTVLSDDEMPSQSHFMGSPASWRPPPSVIGDSQPDNCRMIKEFSSPTRILEVFLQQNESTQEASSQIRTSQLTVEDSLSLEIPQGIASSSFHCHEPNWNVGHSTSPVRSQANSPPRRVHATRYREFTSSPASISRSEVQNTTVSDSVDFTPASGQAANTSNLRKRKSPELEVVKPVDKLMTRDLSRTGVEESIYSSPGIPDTPNLLLNHANSARKRRGVESPSPQNSFSLVKMTISNTTLETSITPIQPPPLLPSPEVAGSTDLPSLAESPQSIPHTRDLFAGLVICSVVPPTSCGNFTHEDIVTSSLAKLGSNPTLQKCFYPTEQTRPLRPLERGYWLIDTRGFDEGLQHRFWGYLRRYISRGDAGWGVSSERAEDWKSIRVNCWGGIVKEIYLLLFIASEGKIKEKDAVWKDGDGKIVISMNSTFWDFDD